MAVRLMLLRHQLKRDPEARNYRDLALTPNGDDNALELLTVTDVARRAAQNRLRPLETVR